MDDADERAEERDLPDWLLPAHRVTPADALRRIQALCVAWPDLHAAMFVVLATHQTLPREVLAVALTSFVLALGLGARLGSEFLPELNEGTFWVNWDLPPSISQEEAAQVLRLARKALLAIPEVRTVVSKAGQPEDGTDPKTLSMAEVFVDVKPTEEWRKGLTREQLIEEMDARLSVIPGVDPAFSQPIRDNVLESISQIKGQIVVKVAGDDLSQLRDTVEAMQRQFKQVQGVQRAEVDRAGEQPQLLIDIDRERAARFGLNVSDVQDVIEAALAEIQRN